MSKILKISKHKLDLARVELIGPSLLIGRSPMCDQVLRAPGIKPVHFLLEWVGEGEFNPNTGMWTLFDMGHLVANKEANTNKKDKELSSEGIVIDQGQQYLGLTWSIVEDRINASNIQRGIISNQLLESVKNKSARLSKRLVLEIVCLSQEEQKVQEIWHFFDKKVDSFHRSKVIPFGLKWSIADKVEMVLTSKPTEVFNLKGQKIDTNKPLILYPEETFIVHYTEEVYFIRFLSRVNYQPTKKNIFKNKVLMVNALSLVLFVLTLWGVKLSQKSFSENETTSLVRVVKVVETEHLPENNPVEKPIPEPMPEAEPVPEKVVEVIKPKKTIATAPSDNRTSARDTVGVNSIGTISDVNAVGLLSKMKNNSGQSKSKQVSIEAINQTFVESSMGKDNKGVLIPTTQMKIIGLKKNNPNEKFKPNDNNLLEAQTTLKGAKDFNPSNSAVLAHSQGINNVHSLGTSLQGKVDESLNNSSTSSANSISAAGAAEVTGGLTKSQVYGVINSHRREIRTCFESALLVRNDLNGILRMSFSINIEGTVTEVKVVNTEIESSILERCVTQIIRGMIFPETPNQLPSTVIYPFVFKRVK